MTNEEKMTPEEAIAEISFLKVAVNEVMEQALDMAIQLLSQEPTTTNNNEPITMVYPTIVCDDAISRDAVIEIICRETEWYDIRTQINELPSVTQKSGKWKVVSDGYGNSETAYICECSECKDTVWVYKDADRQWNYCPNCGCRMVEPQESEDKD